MKTRIRETVTIEPRIDAEFCRAVREYGIRKMARALRLSPAFISQALAGKCGIPARHIDRMRQIVEAKR